MNLNNNDLIITKGADMHFSNVTKKTLMTLVSTLTKTWQKQDYWGQDGEVTWFLHKGYCTITFMFNENDELNTSEMYSALESNRLLGNVICNKLKQKNKMHINYDGSEFYIVANSNVLYAEADNIH